MESVFSLVLSEQEGIVLIQIIVRMCVYVWYVRAYAHVPQDLGCKTDNARKKDAIVQPTCTRCARDRRIDI